MKCKELVDTRQREGTECQMSDIQGLGEAGLLWTQSLLLLPLRHVQARDIGITLWGQPMISKHKILSWHRDCCVASLRTGSGTVYLSRLQVSNSGLWTSSLAGASSGSSSYQTPSHFIKTVKVDIIIEKRRLGSAVWEMERCASHFIFHLISINSFLR